MRRRRRHDPFLKRLYRAGARDAIALFFPDIAAHIDWESLRWIDKETPFEPPLEGDEYRSVVADLVGLTRDIEGHHTEVLIHPEIQTRVPSDIGWRVLQYNAGHTLQEGKPDARVLTFVFYHCPGGDGVQERRHDLDFHGFSVLGVGYWSVGLGELEAEQFAQSDNPMAWALAAWMRKPRTGRVALRLRLIAQILRVVKDAEYRRLLFDAVRSYFRLSPSERNEEQQLLAAREYGEVNEMMETELDQLEARAERRAERRTLQDTLLDVARSRFPSAPPDLEARVRRVENIRSLQALIRRAATATVLDEIGPLPEP